MGGKKNHNVIPFVMGSADSGNSNGLSISGYTGPVVDWEETFLLENSELQDAAELDQPRIKL